MRIMLLFPPNVDAVEPFKSAKAKPPQLLWGFPLGLGYLAAVLRQHGFTVSIRDFCNDSLSLEAIIEEVRRYEPDLVGIGSLTHVLRSSIEIARRIKEYNCSVKIVFGGPHATYDYENLLSLGCIDYIALGEAEFSFLELCKKLRNGETIEDIKGIALRRNEEIKVNAIRPLIEDLDALPFPARELVDFNSYIKSYGVLEKSVDVLSSRGCTNRCAFCSSGHLFGRWRSRSPGNIVKELEFLIHEYPSIKSINYMDDNFTADKERVLKLCALLISRGLNEYNWVCLARVDQLDTEIAHAMKTAGCKRVHLGIESGSPEILKNINKHISLEQAKKAVCLLREAKIEAYSFFMIGHPGETVESITMTRRFARDLKSSNTGVFISQVFPGTRLEQLQPVKNWLEYIYEPEVEHPSIFTHPCVPNFIPQGFTREGLKKICQRITQELIFQHFIRRYRLFIRKLIVEPKATFKYISSVFFKQQ